MDSDEREEWEDEPQEDEDPAVTRRFEELEKRRQNPSQVQSRRVARRPRSTAWIALLLLLASIYLFWVLPYQLGSRPVHVEFSQDKK